MKDDRQAASAGDIYTRLMREEDAEAVALLCGELGYTRNADQVRHWIRAAAPLGESKAALVACRDRQVVGWIEISLEWRVQSSPFALIGGLVVAESERSRGVGRILCAEAERWAQGKGIATVRVTSRSTRLEAHRFYERDGYKKTKLSQVFEKQVLPEMKQA